VLWTVAPLNDNEFGVLARVVTSGSLLSERATPPLSHERQEFCPWRNQTGPLDI
jgi:hypothetical protein